MTARDFAFWLQGLFELGNPEALTKEQTDLVRQHLTLVFKHEIDPSMGDATHQADLNKAHASSKPVVPPSSNEHMTGSAWGLDGARC